ncbi:hypothetical protein NDU88_003619 [Pleurodeles waltl]|uniref:Uncharacterized protein n=1 Tax=Pleurodeles waltl TaxID=8319 RepID=A0AAV7WS62_PLEWA|nr:hypothetical protein NDU88_003619 [Pleurodeles waltl]
MHIEGGCPALSELPLEDRRGEGEPQLRMSPSIVSGRAKCSCDWQKIDADLGQTYLPFLIAPHLWQQCPRSGGLVLKNSEGQLVGELLHYAVAGPSFLVRKGVCVYSTTTTHLIYLVERWRCCQPMLWGMGKTDKLQQKLQFDRRRMPKAQNEGGALPEDRTSDVDMTTESDLKQILKTMQQSLTKIDSKVDDLTFRMDRMLDHLGKHAERLDQAESRLSEVEDD